MNEPSTHPLAYVCKLRDWGPSELASRMVGRGQTLGINLATNRTLVWKWTHKGQVPDVGAQYVLADLLGVPQDQARPEDWPLWLPVWEVSALTPPWTTDGTVKALTDLLRSGRMDRRGFLTITGGTLTGLAAMWADAPEAFASALTGDRVTDTMVSTLEQRVAALRTMDEQLGGGRLLEHAQGDLSLITDLLKSGTYTEAVGARMYALAARICYLTGWIAYDSGLRSAGQQYYVGALRASRTAGDGAFGAFVLAEMGVHAGDAGDTQSRVRLIETAIDSAPKDMPAATQSFLQLHHAEAMSRDGQTQQSATALNASMALWDRHRSTGEALPEWLQWYGQAQLESTEGKIMLRSGSTDRATAALEASIAMAVPRDKATRAPRLAEARLAGGDLDGALDAANAGAALLEGPVSSDRAVTRLNEFSRQLDKYSAVPAVREFRDRLRALPMAS